MTEIWATQTAKLFLLAQTGNKIMFSCSLREDKPNTRTQQMSFIVTLGDSRSLQLNPDGMKYHQMDESDY